MAKTNYKDSAFGIAVHPHITEADFKFNADGLFKTGLRLSGEAAIKMRAEIDALSDAAFKEYMEEGDGSRMTAAERKKYEVYHPYTVEENDDGSETGDIIVHFKQNRTIKLRSGETKIVAIGVYDAADKAMTKTVRMGSEIRVRYAHRTAVMKSNKEVGVRLDFAMVQVRKLYEGKASGGGGFGESIEGGYVDDGEDGGGFGSDGNEGGNAPASGGSDY